MRPVLPACFALAIAGGCDDSSNERYPYPGSRFKLVEETVVSNTCLEGSPRFHSELLEYLDVHWRDESDPHWSEFWIDSRDLYAYGPGGTGDLRISQRIESASSPEGRWIPGRQVDAWPPTDSWEDDDWYSEGESAVHGRTDELGLLRPTYRHSFVIDLDGDFLYLDHVHDLNGCPARKDCEPWGGPCTKRVQRVYEHDYDVPDIVYYMRASGDRWDDWWASQN